MRFCARENAGGVREIGEWVVASGEKKRIGLDEKTKIGGRQGRSFPETASGASQMAL